MLEAILTTKATPLLHAILCSASSYIPAEVLSSSAYQPQNSALMWAEHEGKSFHVGLGLRRTQAEASTNSSARSSFQQWHISQALKSMTACVDRGVHFLQVLQALVLIASVEQLNAAYTDMWLHSGSCIRMAVPLRIYESDLTVADSLTGFGEQLRARAKDPGEQAEMDRTWWMAYLLDRTISVWTNRPSALPEEEITCALPVLQCTFEGADWFGGTVSLRGVQSILDTDLYSSLPECHHDSLVLYIKAVKLYNDAHRFFRMYQRRPHTIERYMEDPTYRLLVSQVNAFRLSIPEHMRRPTKELVAGGQLDRELLISAMYAQATSIILSNPFLTIETWQGSPARMGIVAMRAVLSLIYDREC